MPHHPVNRQVQEKRRHGTSFSNTGLHTEAGFVVSHSALEVVVETPDDKDDLLWNSTCPENAPYTFSVDAVKSLLKIHVVDVQLPLPFSSLFDDVRQGEDLVRESSSFLKTSLLLSESLVLCFRDPPNDELNWPRSYWGQTEG